MICHIWHIYKSSLVGFSFHQKYLVLSWLKFVSQKQRLLFYDFKKFNCPICYWSAPGNLEATVSRERLELPSKVCSLSKFRIDSIKVYKSISLLTCIFELRDSHIYNIYYKQELKGIILLILAISKGEVPRYRADLIVRFLKSPPLTN